MLCCGWMFDTLWAPQLNVSRMSGWETVRLWFAVRNDSYTQPMCFGRLQTVSLLIFYIWLAYSEVASLGATLRWLWYLRMFLAVPCHVIFKVILNKWINVLLAGHSQSFKVIWLVLLNQQAPPPKATIHQWVPTTYALLEDTSNQCDMSHIVVFILFENR